MKAVSINDLPIKYQAQVRHQLAIPAPHMEQGARHEPLAKKKAARPHGQTRVKIHFVSYRHRLADPDGLVGKYVLDSLVSCGILGDDSPEFVESVSHYQCKINKGEEERTEVVITPCNS